MSFRFIFRISYFSISYFFVLCYTLYVIRSSLYVLRYNLLMSHAPRSKLSLHIIINTIGTYLSIGFSLIFVLVLTRMLGRVEYGTLTVLLGVIYIGATVLDCGVTTVIYSAIPPLYKTGEPSKLDTLIKTILYYQTICASIAVIILILLFPLIDQRVLHTGAPYITLTITALSILGFVWQNTVQNMLMAMGKFFEVNLWFNISNVVRLIALAILYAYARVNIFWVICIFGIVGPGVFLGALLYAYTHRVKGVAEALADRELLMFRHSLTSFLAQQFFNIGMRVDLFVLAYFGLKNALGDYGIAQKIILSIISIVVSITQVLSPEFALVKTKDHLKKLLKKSIVYLLIPTALFLVLTITPSWVFKLVFTHKFTDTPALTRSLGFVYSIFGLGQILWLGLLYTFQKAHYLLYTNIIFFIVVAACNFVFIPLYGAYGAPIALCIAFIVMSVAQGRLLWREYEKLPE